MKLEKVSIRSTPEGWLKVDGYRVSSGLAVHRTHVTNVGWTITHTRSGRALVKGIKTRTLAMDACARIAKLTDWTLPGGVLVKQKGLAAKVWAATPNAMYGRVV